MKTARFLISTLSVLPLKIRLKAMTKTSCLVCNSCWMIKRFFYKTTLIFKGWCSSNIDGSPWDLWAEINTPVKPVAIGFTAVWGLIFFIPTAETCFLGIHLGSRVSTLGIPETWTDEPSIRWNPFLKRNFASCLTRVTLAGGFCLYNRKQIKRPRELLRLHWLSFILQRRRQTLKVENIVHMQKCTNLAKKKKKHKQNRCWDMARVTRARCENVVFKNAGKYKQQQSKKIDIESHFNI